MNESEMKTRIEVLEKAIRDAASWVRAGEGVVLWYYHQGYGEEDSVDVLKQVVGDAAKGGIGFDD